MAIRTAESEIVAYAITRGIDPLSITTLPDATVQFELPDTAQEVIDEYLLGAPAVNASRLLAAFRVVKNMIQQRRNLARSR